MKEKLLKVSSSVYLLGVSAVAISLIVYLSYVFGGYEFLVKGNWGTDMTSAYSMAIWIDKYFPSVPFWYPIAGGGVSFINSYPTFSFVLVSLVRRAFSLELVQAFSWVGYASVISFSIGIYLFTVIRTKRPVMGFLASVFYLMSPLAWVWLTDWGFYAEAVSHLFVMPTLICWDRFFVYSISEKRRSSRRRYGMFALTLSFFFFAFITHFGTGYALLGFMGFYVAFYWLRSRNKLTVFKRSVSAWFLVAVSIVLLTITQTYSFYRYSQQTAIASVGSGRSYEQIAQSVIKPVHILGIEPSLVTSGDRMFLNATKNIRFAGVVSILAGLGIIFSFRKKYALVFASFSLFSVFVTTYGRFLYIVANYIPSPVNVFFTWRWTFIALRFTVPFLAAYGLFAVGDFLLNLVKKNKFMLIKRAGSLVIAIALLLAAFTYFAELPGSDGRAYPLGARGIDLTNIWLQPGELVISPEGGEVTKISIAHDQCQTENSCTLLQDQECLDEFVKQGNDMWCGAHLADRFFAMGVKAWCEHPANEGNNEMLCNPAVTRSEVELFWNECQAGNENELCGVAYDSIEDQLFSPPLPNAPDKIKLITWFDELISDIEQDDPDARLDYSPYLSGIGMNGPIRFMGTSLSQLYIYTVSSTSLISKYSSQFSSSLFLDDPFYVKSDSYTDNITKWFGTDYLIFDTRTDQKFFSDETWELLTIKGENNSATIAHARDDISLAEISDKARVAVIGDKSLGAYDTVYQVAHYDVLPYDNYIFIRGEDRIDDYSAEDLAEYDLLVLYGYSYNNLGNTNSLLDNYVRNGGSVFIDTGWQYVTPEWDTSESEALNIIPNEYLSWKEMGIRDDYVVRDFENSGEEVDLDFNPLDYQGLPWGVSTFPRSDIKDWAEPLVTLDDSVLIAKGQLGEGRIVWSGMNIMTHAKQGAVMSQDEVAYLADAFEWLTTNSVTTTKALSYTRNNPDSIEFAVDESFKAGSTLLWKEAYHPDFVAKLISGSEETKLDVEPAGPGWVSIVLPDVSEGDTISYEYRKPFYRYAVVGISMIYASVVLGGFVLMLINSKRNLLLIVDDRSTGFVHGITTMWSNPIKWLNSTENEEDY